jgi:hypothetical protein
MKCCGCDQQVLCIKQGGSYMAADNLAICIDSTGCAWPDNLTDPQIVIQDVYGNCTCPVNGDLTIAGTYTAGPPAKVCFDLTSAQTYALGSGLLRFNFQVVAKSAAGNRIVLRSGRISVT